MADVETTDAAVSSVQVDADSLEFTVNTNLPAACASPKDASPSLQELIEAELNARLCHPDSLEPPVSPNPSSLISCDSIDASTPTLIPAPAPAPNTTVLSLDSLLELDSLNDPHNPHDPLATADAESGIDVLSPTKLDDLSNHDMDSLESSSDLPASSHSSPEPTKTTLTQGGSPTAQNNKDDCLLIVDAGECVRKRSPSLEAEGLLLPTRDDASLAAAQPLLRISESSLTIASETRSEISHMSQEVTRSSTPDSLTSLEASCTAQDTATPQETATLLDTASQDTGALLYPEPPRDNAQNSALLESILLQNSTPLQTTEGSGTLLDSPLVLDSAMSGSQEQETPQESQESVTLLDVEISQENSATLIDMAPQDSGTLLDMSSQQHTNDQEANTITTSTDLLASLGSDEVTADSSPTLPADPASPPSSPTRTSSQSEEIPPLDPTPQGSFPPSGTNSVCGGDLPNAVRDCGVSVGSGVDASTTTTTACSGVGVGGGVSPVQSPLQNGANVSSSRFPSNIVASI